MKNQILFRNIGLYILLVAIFATTAMAFTVTFVTPTGGESFEDKINLFNVTIDLGANANCTLNISDGVHADVIKSVNGTHPEFSEWSPVDISSLNDGDLDVEVYCVEDINSSNFNSSDITIEKETQGPDLYWFNPIDSGTISGNTNITLTINITSDKVVDNTSTSVFTISCADSDDGNLSSTPVFNMINDYNGTVTQNWTTPFDATNCNLSVNVSNIFLAYNDTEMINVDVNQTPYMNGQAVDLDNETYVLIGTGGPAGDEGNYSLIGIFVEVNASGAFGINLTHGTLCIGLDSPTHFFEYDNSYYDGGEDLWESEFNCTVNKSVLVDNGDNVLGLELVLNNSALTTELNFTIYSDDTLPEIHFEWWDTQAWNNSDNSTYNLTLPDYMFLIGNNDIFFAPNDVIYVSINVTDDADYYGNISRVYANFSGLDLDGASTCTGLLELTYNDTCGMWENNCSLGDFADNLTDDPVETGNITFIVYDSYNNTNFYEDYNLSNSSQVCTNPGPECMFLHVPVNLHDFGQLEADDDCYQFNGLTSNLSNIDDWTSFDLIIDMYLNLSCEMNDSSANGNFTPFILFNFSGVDFSTPAMGQKIMMLEESIDFLFTNPRDFGDSWIYINATAFEELDVNSTIIFRHLPFSDMPALVAEIPSHLNSTSVEWVTNGLDPLFDNQVITGNLTFKVFGFSGYDITDNVTPTANITAPGTADLPDSWITVQTYLNGTGTDISYAQFSLNNVQIRNYTNGSDNTANCTLQGAGTNYYYCNFDYNITLGDGEYNISVYAQDFGGDTGNNATDQVTIYLDTVDPSATMNNTPDLNNNWVVSNFFNFTFETDDDHSTTIDYTFWVENSTEDIVQANITGSITAGDLEGAYANLTSGIDNDNLIWYLEVNDQAGNLVEYNATFSLDRINASTIDDNPTGWQDSDFTINLTVTDSTSFVNYTSYRIDGGSWVNGTSIEINTTGNFTIEYYSEDNAGNVEGTNTINALLDKVDPITGDDYDDTWKNSDFIITLLPADINQSGINYTTYRIDGISWINGTNIPVSISGNYSIEYYSVDNVGNDENIITINALLDKILPITGIIGHSNEWVFNASITFNASDNLSGVSYTNYSLDGGVSWITGNSVNFTNTGNFTLNYFSADNAGNQDMVQTVNVLIDATAPNSSDDYSGSGWGSSATTVTVTSDDNNSGVNHTTINGVEQDNITLSTSGNHSVAYYATDNFGNIESTTTIYVALDLTNPTMSGNTPSATSDVTPEISVVISDVHSGINTTSHFIEINNGTPTQYDVTNCSANCNVSDTYFKFYQPDNLSEGVYGLIMRINDLVGNSINITWNMTVDTTSPNITSFTLSDTTVEKGDTLTGTCSANDTLDSDVDVEMTGISSSAVGDFTATCTATDDAGNTITSTVDYTVTSASSSGGAATTGETDVTKIITFESLEPEEVIQITFEKEDLDILGLELSIKEVLDDVKFTIKSLVSKPSSVPDLEGKYVYKYLEIEHKNLDNEDLIGDVVITFRVPKSWMDENDISPEEIVLYRFTDGWDTLTITFLGLVGDYYEFEAITPGMSYFVIGVSNVVEPEEVVTEETTESSEDVVEEESTTTENADEEIDVEDTESTGSSTTKGVITLIIGIIFILIIYFVIFKKKKN